MNLAKVIQEKLNIFKRKKFISFYQEFVKLLINLPFFLIQAVLLLILQFFHSQVFILVTVLFLFFIVLFLPPLVFFSLHTTY